MMFITEELMSNCIAIAENIGNRRNAAVGLHSKKVDYTEKKRRNITLRRFISHQSNTIRICGAVILLVSYLPQNVCFYCFSKNLLYSLFCLPTLSFLSADIFIVSYNLFLFYTAETLVPFQALQAAIQVIAKQECRPNERMGRALSLRSGMRRRACDFSAVTYEQARSKLQYNPYSNQTQQMLISR